MALEPNNCVGVALSTCKAASTLSCAKTTTLVSEWLESFCIALERCPLHRSAKIDLLMEIPYSDI